MADSYIARTRDGVELASEGIDGTYAQEAAAAGPLVELGSTGLKRAAGWLDEEFLPQLRGKKAIEVYREMSQNDSTVSALLYAIDRLLRNVNWRVDPAGKTKAHADAAKLVETSMEDMSHTWQDFVSEALTCMIYGWSWHEIVYKRCVGPWEKDPSRRSKHSDGLIRWRKIPIRSQDTLLRWDFDDHDDVRGMLQTAPPTYKTVYLPIDRSLLFRFRHHKNSPEGISMLRGMYQPWWYKKRLMEFESIGIERDLAGLPIATVPAEMLKAKPGTDAHRSAESFRKLVKSVRRNDQEGLVFPAAYDQETKQPLYKFELLASAGQRTFDTNTIIARYDLAILKAVIADFIEVGHEQTGSYSLHTDKTGLFRTGLNSITQSVADTLNRHAIPRLFLINGMKPAELPMIVPDDVDSPDIAQLAAFMSSMSSMGLQWFPDGELENFLRSAARLPKLDDDQLELRRMMQMRAEATAFAQANMDYVNTQQGLASVIMGQGQPGQAGQPGQPAQPGQGQPALPSGAAQQGAQ